MSFLEGCGYIYYVHSGPCGTKNGANYVFCIMWRDGCLWYGFLGQEIDCKHNLYDMSFLEGCGYIYYVHFGPCGTKKWCELCILYYCIMWHDGVSGKVFWDEKSIANIFMIWAPWKGVAPLNMSILSRKWPQKCAKNMYFMFESRHQHGGCLW